MAELRALEEEQHKNETKGVEKNKPVSGKKAPLTGKVPFTTKADGGDKAEPSNRKVTPETNKKIAAAPAKTNDIELIESLLRKPNKESDTKLKYKRGADEDPCNTRIIYNNKNLEEKKDGKEEKNALLGLIENRDKILQDKE